MKTTHDHTPISNAWLRENGIAPSALLTQPLYVLQAQRIAHDLLQHHVSWLNAAQQQGLLDADIRCLKPFAAADLMTFFPDQQQIMSYLGRDAFPPENPYSECGFLGFNPRHPETRNYLNRVKAVYTTGEIFSLTQRHDCWVWDRTREEFEARANEFKNISGPAAGLDHPFINTGLGKFFDHLKGPARKAAGKSNLSDYRIK